MPDHDEVTLQRVAAQHDRLLNTFEQICRATCIRDDHPVLIVLFEELFALVVEHFRDEEAVMNRMEYPERDWHELQHQLLAADLEVIRARVRNGKGGLSQGDFARLNEIVKTHTEDADARFAQFLAAKSAAE